MKNLHSITRRDIHIMVNDLHEDLVQLFDCEACSVYFPKENEITQPTYIEEEETLLLPLHFKNSTEILGVFLLRKPNKEKVQNLIPSIENFIYMALEKLYLKKAALYDQTTELFTKHSLIQSLTEKIQNIKESFTKPSDFNPNPFLSSGAAGIIYFKLVALNEHKKKYGHIFAEECLQKLSAKILSELPAESMLARVNEFDCALMVSDENCDSRPELNEFLYNLCQNLTSMSFNLPESSLAHNRRINIQVHAGYVLFPQDFDNIIAMRNPLELAHTLLSQAEYSAKRASEQKKRIMPFANLIHEGGTIVKNLPHNQVIINLGRNVGLRESMRFSVYANNPQAIDDYIDENSLLEKQNVYKGDISLIEIFDEFSLAEPTLMHDPSYNFLENDILIKLPDDFMAHGDEISEKRSESPTHLYKYTNFLGLFAEARQRVNNFSLALLQVDIATQTQIPVNTLFAEIIQYFQHSFIAKYHLSEQKEHVIFSRYGENNILCFIPHTDILNENNILLAYKDFASELSEHLQRKIAIGIALHPFLHFKPAEALENCKKALECAKLLDFPHVSFCDSVALTISADKLVTQGMLFEALQEYQNALFADSNNALALNSLGVALVSLKRYNEAQNTFLQALALTPDDISIYYNLGGISEKLLEIKQAKTYYSKCLDSLDYSYFALLRLGLIAENEKNVNVAIDYYKKAIAKNQSQASPYRQLAKIALLDNNFSEAREHLYTALRYTPNDAHSLILLAKIYLENNEDANVISALLSPIMTPRQNNIEAWRIYAQVLKAQGKEYEAINAETKVQNLINSQ